MVSAGYIWADSPHYLKADESIDSNTFCYSVGLKEAGLGTATSVTYTLSADACFTAVCVTKKGNEVQGQPKSGESMLLPRPCCPYTKARQPEP
jgi:hypothetical protein